MHIYPEAEVRGAWGKVLATRERVARGIADWSEVAEHFTEDAIYIDPIWGRLVGAKAIATLMHDGMVGFEEWRFPTLWTVVKDNLVICAFWSRVPGRLPDGSFPDCFSLSLAIYAGNGRFCYENDVFNVVELGELIKESGWVPPQNGHAPPARIDRNQRPPEGADIGTWGLANP